MEVASEEPVPVAMTTTTSCPFWAALTDTYHFYSGSTPESSAEVTRQRRAVGRNTTRHFSEQSRVVSQLDRKLASWNQSERIEEHDRFEVARRKNDSNSAPIGVVGKEVDGYAAQEKWNVDDYEYKIANHQGGGGGRQPGVEIDDKGVNGKDDRDLAEKKKQKKSSGRLARKLLSIEADPVAAVDDRDDTVAVEASDYGVDKAALTASSEFNGGNDDREEHGGQQRRSRRWGSRPNRANQALRRGQEMDQQRRVDSRKSGRAGDSLDDTGRRETIPDESTVYRQRYPPVDDDQDKAEEEEGGPGAPEVVESTTVADGCDCVAKCASERVLQEAETSTEESGSDTGDNDEVTTEEIEQEEEEEGTVDEQEEPEEEEEEEEEEKEELTTEETTSEADGTATKQREVYIDLKIGIKSVGNGSLSEDSEPLEFHRKILVKREKVGDELSYQLGTFRQQQQKPSSDAHFPISLVKAIYQLVDRSDSLRTHVAPRLPSRTKVLSKLSKLDSKGKNRRKINDQQRGRPQHQLESELQRPKKNSNGVDKVVAVIDALKELIQQ
ncbi:caldesmon-like [Culex pipiens pallens]|uniref:caldesmon-like n=1 Tax=Culex pipiens pallens TaxID=42434 RepID=UPI0022AA14C1|nr:caldesmon-like [Culex pipiens pallens]